MELLAMASDEWPRIVCERFDGESETGYRQRARRIEEIILGFRMGRIRPEVADEVEEELLALQEPGNLWRLDPAQREQSVA
jgi:hypothetical protein